MSTHRPVPGTTNLRDLGGVPVRGGHVTPGRLLRAEALARSGTAARCEGGAGDTDFLAAMRAGRLTSFTAGDLADLYTMIL